jgi:hypothetical protein
MDIVSVETWIRIIRLSDVVGTDQDVQARNKSQSNVAQAPKIFDGKFGQIHAFPQEILLAQTATRARFASANNTSEFTQLLRRLWQRGASG